MNLPPKKISYLIYKHLLEEISPTETELLRKWREDRSENELYFQRICAAYEQGDLDGWEVEQGRAWQSVDQVIHAPQRRIFSPRWMLYLSVCFAFVVFVAIIYFFDGSIDLTKGLQQDIVWYRATTSSGERKVVTLPDSSTVWLNAESWIQYPSCFSDTAREVTIEGEAFFDVRKFVGRKREFVRMKVNVMRNASKVESVEVTGTRFNIHARSNTSKIRTTLFEGEIIVIRGRFAKAILPGQQSIVEVSGSDIPIEVIDKVDTSAILGWRQGYLQFEDADVASVFRELESHFGYRFYVRRKIRGEITARFDSTYSVRQICDFIAQITDAKFSFKDSVVIVK